MVSALLYYFLVTVTEDFVQMPLVENSLSQASSYHSYQTRDDTYASVKEL